MKIAVVGAGLSGRLLAYHLKELGHKITLFDANSPQENDNCAWVAAGMLSPLAESVTAEQLVYDLGAASLKLWPQLLEKLDKKNIMQQSGSILVAHTQDKAELNLFMQQLDTKVPAKLVQSLDKQQILELEPELTNFSSGVYLTSEGQLDNRALLVSLAKHLTDSANVSWLTSTPVTTLSAYSLETAAQQYQFDWVFDCRGMGAAARCSDLRGVRGESIWVSAPEVKLTRPVRLMHPRYCLYIVPKVNDIYVIGATSIESDDASPVSVRSALELLSAAYSVHAGFAEAHISELQVGIRPAFNDNLPKITHQAGLTSINGLYRHGFLMAPAIVEQAIQLFEGGSCDYPQLLVAS
jgi:glycine oxidase